MATEGSTIGCEVDPHIINGTCSLASISILPVPVDARSMTFSEFNKNKMTLVSFRERKHEK